MKYALLVAALLILAGCGKYAGSAGPSDFYSWGQKCRRLGLQRGTSAYAGCFQRYEAVDQAQRQQYWNTQADLWGGALRDIGRQQQNLSRELLRQQLRQMNCTSSHIGSQTYTSCY